MTFDNFYATSAETNIQAVDDNSSYMELLWEFGAITWSGVTKTRKKEYSTMHHMHHYMWHKRNPASKNRVVIIVYSTTARL